MWKLKRPTDIKNSKHDRENTCDDLIFTRQTKGFSFFFIHFLFPAHTYTHNQTKQYKNTKVTSMLAVMKGAYINAITMKRP